MSEVNIDNKVLTEIYKFMDHPSMADILFNYYLALLKKVPIDSIIVEVGTRQGGLSLMFMYGINLLKIRKTIFTIDPYGNKPYKQGEETLQLNYSDDYYYTAMGNIGLYSIGSPYINHAHWKITSIDFIKIWDLIGIWDNGKYKKGIDVKYGFVYLDGEHNDKVVADELNYFIPRLAKNGNICIDDTEHIYKSNIPVIQNAFDNGEQIGNRLYFNKTHIG